MQLSLLASAVKADLGAIDQHVQQHTHVQQQQHNNTASELNDARYGSSAAPLRRLDLCAPSSWPPFP